MMRWALALLVLVLAGCTGQNVDESFLDSHGAVLARVECLNTDAAGVGTYRAIMFLDGSVLATKDGQLDFFERGDTNRTHAPIGLGILTGAPASSCGGTYEDIYKIESGDLVKDRCDGNPASRHTTTLKDLSTDCSGFNKEPVRLRHHHE